MAVFGLGSSKDKDKDKGDTGGDEKTLQFDPLMVVRVLPWLIALLLLLGIWNLVSGSLHQLGESRQHALESSRDDVNIAVQRVLEDARQKFATQIASASFTSAMATGVSAAENARQARDPGSPPPLLS